MRSSVICLKETGDLEEEIVIVYETFLKDPKEKKRVTTNSDIVNLPKLTVKVLFDTMVNCIWLRIHDSYKTRLNILGIDDSVKKVDRTNRDVLVYRRAELVLVEEILVCKASKDR